MLRHSDRWFTFSAQTRHFQYAGGTWHADWETVRGAAIGLRQVQAPLTGSRVGSVTMPPPPVPSCPSQFRPAVKLVVLFGFAGGHQQ